MPTPWDRSSGCSSARSRREAPDRCAAGASGCAWRWPPCAWPGPGRCVLSAPHDLAGGHALHRLSRAACDGLSDLARSRARRASPRAFRPETRENPRVLLFSRINGHPVVGVHARSAAMAMACARSPRPESPSPGQGPGRGQRIGAARSDGRQAVVGLDHSPVPLKTSTFSASATTSMPRAASSTCPFSFLAIPRSPAPDCRRIPRAWPRSARKA